MSEAADDPPTVNPYAAPAAELRAERADESSGSAAFYAMSPRKIAVMSMLTMSFYDLCFWWRHWRTRREHGDDVNVFWRTFFAVFFAFDFKKRVSVALAARDLVAHPLLGAAPALYLISYIVDNALSRVPGFHAILLVMSLLMSVLRSTVLATLQKSVNQVLAADGYRGPVNRGASARTYAVAVVGLLIWALVLLGAVLPDAEQSSS